MNTALWWIRRDLRLGDNHALPSALRQATAVIPVFILDPRLLASPYVGQARLGFLFKGLRALDASLRSRGEHAHCAPGRSTSCASCSERGNWRGRHLC